jgi:hypothetical protein
LMNISTVVGLGPPCPQCPGLLSSCVLSLTQHCLLAQNSLPGVPALQLSLPSKSSSHPRQDVTQLQTSEGRDLQLLCRASGPHVALAEDTLTLCSSAATPKSCSLHLQDQRVLGSSLPSAYACVFLLHSHSCDGTQKTYKSWGGFCVATLLPSGVRPLMGQLSAAPEPTAQKLELGMVVGRGPGQGSFHTKCGG